ncbi:hypothetical protein AAE478_000120 [Parahypoxylon ruwenzoriense]
MGRANLTTLPLEILIQITSYLEVQGYGAVRLTCKDLEVRLFREFARNFFTRIKFMRTQFSLQSLIDISKSRLSPHLRYLAIGLETIPRRTRAFLDAMEGAHFNETQAVFNRLNRLSDDQAVLLNTGQVQLMLAEAFHNLKLERVEINGVREQPSGLPCNTSYGISHIYKEISTAVKPTMIFGNHAGSRTANSSCVQNILFALGTSGAKLKEFAIDFGKGACGDEAFNIPTFMEKDVSSMLSHIDIIDLAFELCVVPYHRWISPEGLDPYRIETYHLRKFLSYTSQIKCLRLRYVDPDDGFFEWLGVPTLSGEYDGPAILKPPGPPMFTKLSELELSALPIPAQQLLCIIRKFSATLRKLTLHRLLLNNFNTDMPTRFIAELARMSSSLNEVYMDLFARVGSSPRVIEFEKGGRSSKLFSYSGPDLKEELDGLKMVIPKSPPIADESLSDAELYLSEDDLEDYIHEYDEFLYDMDQDPHLFNLDPEPDEDLTSTGRKTRQLFFLFLSQNGY